MTKRLLARRGLTLLEAVLALTITAILMVAVGMALVASSGGIKANQDFARATRTAQIALQNISTAARTAHKCDVEAGAAADATAGPSNVLYVTRLSSGVETKSAYIYDAPAGMLLLDTTPPDPPITTSNLPSIRVRMGGTTPTVFPLARQIGSASFTGKYDQRLLDELGNTETRLVSLRIRLIVDTGSDKLELSESVVPRTSHEQ